MLPTSGLGSLCRIHFGHEENIINIGRKPLIAVLATGALALTGFAAANAALPAAGPATTGAAATVSGSVKVIDGGTNVIQDEAWFNNAYSAGYRVFVSNLASGGSCSPTGSKAAMDSMFKKALDAKMLIAGYADPSCWQQALGSTGYSPEFQFLGLNAATGKNPVARDQINGVKKAGGTPVILGSAKTWGTVQAGASLGSFTNLWDYSPSGSFDPLNFTADYTSPKAVAFGPWTSNPDSNTYRVGVYQGKDQTLWGISGIGVSSFDSNFLSPVAPAVGSTSSPSAAPTSKPAPTASQRPSIPPSAPPTAPAAASPAPAPGASPAPATASPTPATAPRPSAAPAATGTYPLHSNVVSTTFWVGEIFNANLSDGSQVCSTYDSQWAAHWSGKNAGTTPSSASGCPGSYYGGCDGISSGSGTSFKCATEPRTAANRYFPTSQPKPAENPFYLDLPYDDINDATAFKERCSVIPWAQADNAASGKNNCANSGYSYMKNHWVKLTGPNGNVCYGQIEDAGPSSGSAYHDSSYVFGVNDARPANRQFSGDASQGAGADVSPALNGCLGFADLDGDADHVSWQFVDSANVPAGPWTDVVTSRQVSN